MRCGTKPEVTQSWRVGRAARRPVPGGRRGGGGAANTGSGRGRRVPGLGLREPRRPRSPAVSNVWGVGEGEVRVPSLGDTPPSLWPAPVHLNPESQSGPLWTEAPAFRLPVSDPHTDPGPYTWEGGWGLGSFHQHMYQVAL